MKFVIDRFENGFAVIELQDGEIVNLPIQILPMNTKEGDVVILKVSQKETDKRNQEMYHKYKHLWID